MPRGLGFGFREAFRASALGGIFDSKGSVMARKRKAEEAVGAEAVEVDAPASESGELEAPEVDTPEVLDGLVGVPFYAKTDLVAGDRQFCRGDICGVAMLPEGMPIEYFLQGYHSGKFSLEPQDG